MSAFFYGVSLQWKLDIRSKSLLITCYLVPLLFFVIMGGIFTSIMPNSKNTLIQSMTVMGVSMGALIGLPPSLAETYGSDIKKMYQANGVPLYFGLVSMVLSAFVHLFLMSVLLFLAAPLFFDANMPENIPLYFGSLAVFIVVSLSLGSILGLACKNQAKLTMISQIFFLPSIMLSGIMFPVDFLPKVLEIAGKIFPASWGYLFMVDYQFENLWPLLWIFLTAILICVFLIKKMKTE